MTRHRNSTEAFGSLLELAALLLSFTIGAIGVVVIFVVGLFTGQKQEKVDRGVYDIKTRQRASSDS